MIGYALTGLAALFLAFDTVMKLLEEESPKLLITIAKDEETLSTKAQAELSEATFRLVDEAGAHMFLAEGDPRRCDQIIKSWEDRAGTTAFWSYPGSPIEKAKVALR